MDGELSTIGQQIRRIADYQRPPDRVRERIHKTNPSLHSDKMFGSVKKLLDELNPIVENETPHTESLQKSILDYEWMFDTELHEKPETNVLFHRQGENPNIDVSTVEVQFSVSGMIEAAARSGSIPPQTAASILEHNEEITRCSDFGLSIILPLEELGLTNARNNEDLAAAKEKVTSYIKSLEEVEVVVGGYTSGIQFARTEETEKRAPYTESDVSQQFLSRSKIDGKKRAVITCPGPGMELNRFSHMVSPQDPFGPRDHMLALSSSLTLFGLTDLQHLHYLDFYGHSMGGASVVDLFENYTFPPNLNVSVIAFDPAVAGTNAWANAAERDISPETAMRSLLQKLLAIQISGGLQTLDTIAQALHNPVIYAKLKRFLAENATSWLFLPGDRRHMPNLIKKHMTNLLARTDAATLSAMGSIVDTPVNWKAIRNKVYGRSGNSMRLILVADAQDQMVDTRLLLSQLPSDLPLFVLTDGDDRGSHYAFKRNSRQGRISILRQCSRLSQEKFVFLLNGFQSINHGLRLDPHTSIEKLVQNELRSKKAETMRIFGLDEAGFEELFTVFPEDPELNTVLLAFRRLSDQVHFNETSDI
ncbi:MAG: hypothetical protein WC489_03385 [Patescibacteria group bacterium]